MFEFAITAQRGMKEEKLPTQKSTKTIGLNIKTYVPLTLLGLLS